MKLMGQVSRTYKDRKYKKHWIIIPEKLVQKLGWNDKDELKAKVSGKKLVVAK